MDVISRLWHHNIWVCMGWVCCVVVRSWQCSLCNCRSRVCCILYYMINSSWESSTDDDSCLEFASLQTALAYVSILP